MASHHQTMPLRQALTRSVAEECGAARAVPFNATSHSAFQVESGRTYEITGLTAGSLDDALTQAISLRAFSHKQHLIIREESDHGVKLYVYAIKRRAVPRYVHRDHVTKRVHDLYADPVCVIDGSAL